MSTPVIKAVGLTKVFRDFWCRARVRAVSDLDLVVQPGEVFGLLGPNGSGKSTAIKMMLGLLYPTRGRVTIFDRPPDDVRIKARIGYLPEESYLYRFLNARETLEYYGTLFRLERRDRKRRIEELLDMVGLRPAARRPVGEYSKGMARRIGLAQALINDPDLLILDEPTSGLDPIGAKLIKDLIVWLGRTKKKTIVLSSHLLADVEEVCDRVSILYGGKVQEAGRLEDILARRDMVQLTCERLSPDTLEQVLRTIEAREGKAVSVGVPRDRLESLFLRIVQRAQEQRLETGGAAPAGAIAGFLGGEQQGEALLESLLRVEPVAVPSAASAVPAAPTGIDAEVLVDLTTAARQPDAREAAVASAPLEPAPPAPVDVDREILADLLDSQQAKDKK